MSQQTLIAQQVYMERVEPSENVQRFYALAVWPDLFGGYSLVREWGRIGGGSTMTLTQQADAATALRKLQQAVAVKERRGYTEIA